MAQKLIIDTDAGVDDSIAILMCLLDPNTEIIGITACAGNCPLLHVVPNVLASLYHVYTHYKDTAPEISAKAAKIKIYYGATRSLMMYPTSSVQWHEADGLGAALTKEEREKHQEFARKFDIIQKTEANAAVDFIIKNPRVNVLVLGPMTNMALVAHTDPLYRQGRIVCMGGSFDGIGNTSMTSEFNVCEDVESFYIANKVFSLEIVDWSCTRRSSLSFELWDTFSANSFLARISKKIRDKSRPIHSSYLLADPLAALVMIRPESILSYSQHNLDIVLHGLARGMTVIDKRRKKSEGKHKIIETLDLNLFEKLTKQVASIL